MATYRCPACKAGVEKTARDCPSCNRPIAPVNWWKVVDPLWLRHAPDAQVVDCARRWMPIYSWVWVGFSLSIAMAISWVLWKHHEDGGRWMEVRGMIQTDVAAPGVDGELANDISFLIGRVDSYRRRLQGALEMSLVALLMGAGYIAFHQLVAKRLAEVGNDGVGTQDGAPGGHDRQPGDSS